METSVLNKQNLQKGQKPWKGLDFYKETDIIYGRDVETESLFEYIRHNTQVVLYGRSGIGKSSILNAGIFPRARQERMAPIAIKLSHSNRISYLDQIKHAISKAGIEAYEVLPVAVAEQETLWEYFHRHQFFYEDSRVTLLVVFDQFEEIFTLQTTEQIRKDFFAELADLINNVMPYSLVHHISQPTRLSVLSEPGIHDDSTSNDINLDIDLDLTEESENQRDYFSSLSLRMVFAIREDFLSYLERYTAHIPPMRDNRFVLLPLNEEQASEVILRPYPGLVDVEVAKLIISKVTGNDDFQLNGMQGIEVDAAVLSLYLSRLYDEMVKRGETHITANLVEQAGTNIIQKFYDDSISPLSHEKQVELEYQLLTVNDRRDNISRSDFLSLGFTEEEIHYLVEEVKLLRQFSMRDDLRLEFIHDILCPVVKERKEQRIIQHQQEEERVRQEEEKRKLQEEAEKRQREIEDMEAEAKRVRSRNRKWVIALSSIIGFILISVVVYMYCFVWPYSENFGNFTTKNGWPIGLGDQLRSSEDKDKCTVYYRLTRDGRLSSFMGKSRPFTKVEIRNWKDEPTTNMFVESPLVRIIDKELDDAKAAEFAKLLSRVSYWLYSPDTNGLISKKTAFDINDQELYSENYYSTNCVDLASKHVMWGVFYDNKGNQLQISNNGIDRIRYTVSNGYITGCSFYTVLGTPQPNTAGDYGYIYEVDSISANILSQYEVDRFGDEIDSTLVYFSEFENGRYTKSSVCSVKYSKQLVVKKYKGYNDTIHISDDGFVDVVSGMSSASVKISMKYKSSDDLLEKKRFSNDTLVYSANYYYSSKLDSIRVFNIESDPQTYTERFTYPSKGTTDRSFWSNGKKIIFDLKVDSIKCHRIRKETAVQGKDSIITTTFYNCDDLLTKEGVYSKNVFITERESGRVLREYEYAYNNSNEICKSEMWMFNEYGVRVSRAVAGIDRTPVRCPNWDWDGFAYYRMSLVRDFNDLFFAAVKAVNESGETGYIVDTKKHRLFVYNESPLTEMHIINSSELTGENGIKVSESKFELFDNKPMIPFLHVLSKDGTLYTSRGANNINQERDGLYDNDVLYQIGSWRLGASPQLLAVEWRNLSKNGGDIKILRFIDGNYVLLSFFVQSGDMKAEYHILPVTNIELDNFKKFTK